MSLEKQQLQKMPLSDSQERNMKQKQHPCSEFVSQEQNKKRKHHNGSENGFHHFVISVWGKDVTTDEEDLETFMEELALIKSLECTRCGINCVCKQELESDYMDEMPSSGMFSYGAAEALKRGPDPDPWSPW